MAEKRKLVVGAGMVAQRLVEALESRGATAAFPVTAEPLRVAGFAPLVPERARLGALVRLIVASGRRFDQRPYSGGRAPRPGNYRRVTSRCPAPGSSSNGPRDGYLPET
ncbi:MAG: hypothetical protein ACR2FE_02215 [Aeromicrobium sp.]